MLSLLALRLFDEVEDATLGRAVPGVGRDADSEVFGVEPAMLALRAAGRAEGAANMGAVDCRLTPSVDGLAVGFAGTTLEGRGRTEATGVLASTLEGRGLDAGRSFTLDGRGFAAAATAGFAFGAAALGVDGGGCEMIRPTLACLTNKPCPGGHSKYLSPRTAPSFFPSGVESSIPSHIPSATCIGPTYLTRPCLPSEVSTVWPILYAAAMTQLYQIQLLCRRIEQVVWARVCGRRMSQGSQGRRVELGIGEGALIALAMATAVQIENSKQGREGSSFMQPTERREAQTG